MRARKIFTDWKIYNPGNTAGRGWQMHCNLIRTEVKCDDYVPTFFTLFLAASNEYKDEGKSSDLLLDECRTDAQAIRKAIEIFDNFVNEIICEEAAIKGASDCAGSDLDEEHEVMTAAEIANDPRI
jgi:hypothetical protein